MRYVTKESGIGTRLTAQSYARESGPLEDGWVGTPPEGQLRRTIITSMGVNSGREGNDERRESSETAPTAVCESAHTHTPVLTDVEMSLTIALGPSDNWVPVSLTPAIHYPLSTSDSHFAIRRSSPGSARAHVRTAQPTRDHPLRGLGNDSDAICVCVSRSRLTPYSHDLHSI